MSNRNSNNDNDASEREVQNETTRVMNRNITSKVVAAYRGGNVIGGAANGEWS
jgi:hypothetical protein